jgi:hypothetical protein
LSVDRLVVVWCPSLLEEGERGEEARSFLKVLDAIEELCPFVEPVRLGVCALPARGPSRFFGGEPTVVELLSEAVGDVLGTDEAQVGVADGLFATTLAARAGVIVERGATPAFLAPLSTAMLCRPDLAVTLQRLGVHTLGQFAALPARNVLARFGADAARCHQVARGAEGELTGLRDPAIFRRLQVVRGASAEGPRQSGFFGGTLAADSRAAGSCAQLQERLGAESVVVGRVRGGRSPADRSFLAPWGSREIELLDEAAGKKSAPWPGQLPAPSPVVVLTEPIAAELFDAASKPVRVSGRGLLSGLPAHLSVGGGPFQEVTAWAGPWPTSERWWSTRRHRARLQVVTRGGMALLLCIERSTWWVEALYD